MRLWAIFLRSRDASVTQAGVSASSPGRVTKPRPGLRVGTIVGDTLAAGSADPGRPRATPRPIRLPDAFVRGSRPPRSGPVSPAVLAIPWSPHRSPLPRCRVVRVVRCGGRASVLPASYRHDHGTAGPCRDSRPGLRLPSYRHDRGTAGPCRDSRPGLRLPRRGAHRDVQADEPDRLACRGEPAGPTQPARQRPGDDRPDLVQPLDHTHHRPATLT
jgi:hypothetical protein